MRGYFEIGICAGKRSINLGTLWRSAYQLGASGIFTIGKRYSQQCSDTTAAWRHIPLREYTDFEHFLSCKPYNCQLIGVEIGGRLLNTFVHPERALYLLGAEDYGLMPSITIECQHVISIESINMEVYNVAVAGSIIMYHRLITKG